jgi:hypothetical protein
MGIGLDSKHEIAKTNPNADRSKPFLGNTFAIVTEKQAEKSRAKLDPLAGSR